MRKSTIFSYLLLLSLVCSKQLIAQTPDLSFKNYSSSQGLSSGNVYAILKDSNGFLWFATEDGLNRFDGTNFKVYRHDPANPNSLKVNHITSLFESQNGLIWIGTAGGGLYYYDREKDYIFGYIAKGNVQVGPVVNSVKGDKEGLIWVTCFGGLYIIDSKNKELITQGKHQEILRTLNGKIPSYTFQDSKQRIWIGSEAGLYLYNPGLKSIQLFNHLEGDDSSLSGNAINMVVEDARGNIWISSSNGISRFMPESNKFRNISRTAGNPRISSNLVYAIATDKKNKLWIGTDEALDLLDIDSDQITSYVPDLRNPRSISSRSIRSILIDDQGIFWVGTFRGGVNKHDDRFNYFKIKEFNPFDPNGLRSSIVTSFAEYQKSVFIGTDGGGLHLFNRNTGLLDYINLPIIEENDRHDLSVLALETSRDNQIWVGTYMNGLYCYNPVSGSHKHYSKGPAATDLNHNDIFCLKQDRNGNIWAGTNGGGINVIKQGQIEKHVSNPAREDDPTRPASNFIRAFEEDQLGRMWIGGFGSGISVYDPATKKFSFYNTANSGLPSNYIISIKEDSKGNIWVGTNGNGIGLLKKGSKQFEALTEKDGLANGIVNKIIEDVAGKIWISTNNGLSCYDPGTKKFKSYSIFDGLQKGAFLLGAGLKLSDGELFFGGQNGFNHFNPSNFKTNQQIPKVVLTGLKIDNVPVLPYENGPIERSMLLADEIHLKYKQGFSISFEALDFTVPEANQYEYKLEGSDNNWIRAGKEHNAYYANIEPGNYVFKVRASNNDGVWNNEGRSIKVFVAPPLWRSIYAYILYALLIVALLFYIRQRGIHKLQTRFALQQERQQARQLIERERKEAEYLHKLDQVKIKFLTNLSHEFRTPISLIIGPIDNLLTHLKEEVFTSQLKLVKRNTRRLLNLVNQLLDFRKMEEQELKLQNSEGDIVVFIQEVCDSFHDLAKRNKITLNVHSEINELPVVFDHDKVERILFNLLSNAFKFTPENGQITVTVTTPQTIAEQGFSQVNVSIKDTGIGIPKEAQAHIFDSFFQHDTGPEILNLGTGIGLSITREFVKMHGGTIWVDSEVGKGSNFTFELTLKNAGKTAIQSLPAINNEHLQHEEYKDTPIAPTSDQPSILIVEDDDDFRFYIKENLKPNYEIYEAVNGKEGWQRTLFNHPDVIVCDVQMPVMNGLELAQKLKADKRTKHIPIILLTAADSPKGNLYGLESGAIDYMTKPFDFAILQAKIHNLLILNQSFKETYSKQVTVSLPETEMVSEKDRFLQKTLAFIYENLDNPQLSVEVLSGHMCISRASLYNRLLEFTGMSPVEFIRSVKLEKAKDLLEKSDMTVTEIAYETGFANPNYFTKVFKARYKLTPSEFQAEKRNR